MLVIIVACLVVAPHVADAKSSKRIPVQFWHVGDDGLSQKLAAEVESEFKRSSNFTLSSERKPDTLVVTIPTNVRWKKIGERIQVLYTVEFSSIDRRKISVAEGSCWEDKLGECAARIAKDARVAARRLNRSYSR